MDTIHLCVRYLWGTFSCRQGKLVFFVCFIIPSPPFPLSFLSGTPVRQILDILDQFSDFLNFIFLFCILFYVCYSSWRLSPFCLPTLVLFLFLIVYYFIIITVSKSYLIIPILSSLPKCSAFFP